jgi:hypothetical protein
MLVFDIGDIDVGAGEKYYLYEDDTSVSTSVQ